MFFFLQTLTLLHLEVKHSFQDRGFKISLIKTPEKLRVAVCGSF